MARSSPHVRFERYSDDVIVHCGSEQQARFIRKAIATRLARCGLGLHPAKTRIVYCKDADRRGSHADERFDFLGYTFRPAVQEQAGNYLVNFSPAVADDAAKEIRREIRRWRLHRRSDKSLQDLAPMFNVVVQGWINYYGRFYGPRCIRLSGRSTTTWCVGPWGSTSGCGAGPGRRGGGWPPSRDGTRTSSLTGGLGLRPEGWAMGAG